MPDREIVIKELQIERECVSRDCDRDCGKCDLVQDRDWLLSVYDDALAMLEKQEEVVRCKDCKWWDKKDGSNYGYCHACKHEYHSDHWEIGIYRTYKGDWFCADGERKDEVKKDG